MIAYSLNIIGLFLDISGVIILFFYGLPAEVDKNGYNYYIGEEEDGMEKKKYKRYKKISRIGLALIFLGFIFQAGASFIWIHHI